MLILLSHLYHLEVVIVYIWSAVRGVNKSLTNYILFTISLYIYFQFVQLSAFRVTNVGSYKGVEFSPIMLNKVAVRYTHLPFTVHQHPQSSHTNSISTDLLQIFHLLDIQYV